MNAISPAEAIRAFIERLAARGLSQESIERNFPELVAALVGGESEAPVPRLYSTSRIGFVIA